MLPQENEEQVAAFLAAHPAFHVGDTDMKPIAQTKAEDGTTYAMLRANLLGPNEFMLTSTKTPDEITSWARPIPIAI